ncbi:hypothetical protein GALMADRAFT_1124326 [Galerina marginata CBS 339.88]|uniref:BTB domain-containing protein n=1 Tax=Galerina marginata (strain CBS 339.88) TaxID=685588 RepID=A0A067TQG5_GALM3|nr:hypothetical protein GALMADRAFT_1124326 [Galerina marginata CBS 339.88]
MSTVNLSMFPDSIVNPASAPYNTNITAEQPWVDTNYSLHNSDIEVRSSDGFVFQLHRLLLEATTGAFPGSEMDTGGEIVQLTESAEVLAILFKFLYPKALPDLHGTSFTLLAAVAEAAGKYEVFSAAAICNERLVYFFPDLPLHPLPFFFD